MKWRLGHAPSWTPPLGTTGRTGYIKVRSLEELEQPELRKWIELAGRSPGWKAIAS
jgi:hypothetical protein